MKFRQTFLIFKAAALTEDRFSICLSSLRFLLEAFCSTAAFWRLTWSFADEFRAKTGALKFENLHMEFSFLNTK